MSLVTLLKCKIFDSKQLYDGTMDIIDNELRSSEIAFAILLLKLIPPSFHCSSLNYLPLNFSSLLSQTMNRQD